MEQTQAMIYRERHDTCMYDDDDDDDSKTP